MKRRAWLVDAGRLAAGSNTAAMDASFSGRGFEFTALMVDPQQQPGSAAGTPRVNTPDDSSSDPAASPVLGRTHASLGRAGPRPAVVPPRDLAELLGDLDPVDWDPLRGAGVGPLTDAGLQTQAPQGAVLGAYQIVQRLGVGGFGAVYLARHVEGRGEVALKVLTRNMAMRPDFLQRFYREAHTLARLQHPHIVRGLEAFEARGWHCFAMEYVDGDSMLTWLKRLGRLKVADAVHIALCLAAGLQYAHERSLVHRDVKPENILLTRAGLVKLADLGLAKATDEDLSLTRSGTGFGTPHYMAPEQARNAKHADPRSDVYALGTTLFHFLTGQLPFKGETALELILAKEQAPLPPMRRFNPEVPEHLDLLVYKMLAKNINHRYQSCAELGRDLQRLNLANPALSFIQEGSFSDAETVTNASVPDAVTRQVVIAVKPTSSVIEEKLPELWWHVRHKTSQGEQVVRKLTTRQLQELIRDERFDMKAEARADGQEEFQPLVFFPEFQGSLLKRQSLSMKTSAADSSVRLQKLYGEAQTRMQAQQERRRKADEDEQNATRWARSADVEDGLTWVQQFWRHHRHTTMGRLIMLLGFVIGGGLGIWGMVKVIGLLKWL